MSGIVEVGSDEEYMISPEDLTMNRSGSPSGGYSRVDEMKYQELIGSHGVGLVEYGSGIVLFPLDRKPVTDRDPVRNPRAYAVGKFLAKRKKKAGSEQKTQKKKRTTTKKKAVKKVTKKRGGKR